MTEPFFPDQLGIVTHEYQDPEDSAYTQWSIPSARAAADGNVVVPFLYGDDLFAQMAKDFATAKTKEHFIYLTGFETQLDTPMAGKTLDSHLARAIGAGVVVRGLFNGERTQRLLQAVYDALPGAVRAQLRRPTIKDNKPVVDRINELGKAPGADASALLDNHVALTGAQHQKIVIVNGEAGLVAYCGGSDIAKPRQSRTGWHDVHCRIVGPAAYDLFTLFDARWTQNIPVLRAILHPLASPTKQPPVGGKVVTYSVQIAQTWPGTIAFPFSPAPEKTVYSMILNAIRRSTKFIYVEDQFMVCDRPLFIRELKARLAVASFKFLLLLTGPDSVADASLMGQAAYRRKLLVDELRSENPQKVIVCTRNDLYFHAKTWVFDDKFAIIGSANMNNRGYFSDSEVTAGIADKNEGGARLGFAHRLRMALWMKHLDISANDALDPETGVDRWKTPTAKISPYVTRGRGSFVDDILWRTIVDPT